MARLPLSIALLMKGFTVKCTTPGGDAFLAALGRQLCARAGPANVTAATTSSLLAVTARTVSSTRFGRDGHYTVAPSLPTLFGWALGWIMCNRPAALGVTLKPRDDDDDDNDDDGDDGDNQRQASAAAVHFPPATVPVSFANRPTMDTDPTSAVEVFHLHCHFQNPQGSQGSQGQTKSQTKSQTPGVIASSEAAALRVLEDTKAAIRAGGSTPLHDHVWHGKNGPHDPWSWELWVEDTEALGHAALHFLRVATAAAGSDGAGSDGAGSGADEGLYFAIHCDTDQEYTDHAARMCWVGRTDPLPLDLHFFTPEEGYEGPDASGNGRRSNGETLYSMGEGGFMYIHIQCTTSRSDILTLKYRLTL